jgi:hypothetical protein
MAVLVNMAKKSSYQIYSCRNGKGFSNLQGKGLATVASMVVAVF